MKAIIWGSCGSLPAPSSSADIRGKIKAALWAARNEDFESQAEIDRFLDRQPFTMQGTYKANTSCIQIEAGTKDVILCDAGTGIRDYALSLPDDAPPRTYHIFLSHLHWDHIQGFPFFTPAYQPGTKVIFHGFHTEIESAIRKQMADPCFPVPFETMQAEIIFDIQECGANFEVGDVHVSAIKQQHPGDSWGYRFEQSGKSIVFSSDSEHGQEAKLKGYPFVDFIKDADVLIFDGQYTFEEANAAKRNWGHSNPITAVELAARANVGKLVIFHHEPGYDDSEIEQIHKVACQHRTQFNETLNKNSLYPKSIALAYDGLSIST